MLSDHMTYRRSLNIIKLLLYSFKEAESKLLGEEICRAAYYYIGTFDFAISHTKLIQSKLKYEFHKIFGVVMYSKSIITRIFVILQNNRIQYYCTIT